MIYRTETQEDYNALMGELERKGYKWVGGEKPTERLSVWEDEKEDTCVGFGIYGPVYYGSANWFTGRGYKITKYKAPKQEEQR
ncbi:hypothetical protein ACFFIF_01830 [Vagococcus entomophilus]|uniref:Uncharacterized protein n=1 Tax=Vagococcus entomophilus TaxID=1160095 RepID=A0A430AK77_9ENTE|nr:hypothetical protein [Vagococcus entomophilus]RSU08459.1 hypothetical protein CBF30_04255 [Vagococcus entomophilus]